MIRKVSSSNDDFNIKIDNLVGDKSLSHRALIFAALNIGVTKIQNLNNGLDVLATIESLQNLGVKIIQTSNEVIIYGSSIKGLFNKSNEINCANSGTTARFLLGLISAFNFDTNLIGDNSLSKRPMKRLGDLLEKFLAKFHYSNNGMLPITILGSKDKIAQKIDLNIPSAQIKSALILLALNSYGTTIIKEKTKTRDHTENMLEHFGAAIQSDNDQISIEGHQQFFGNHEIYIANDPSQAAFLAAITILKENSKLTITNICINKYRVGFFKIIEKMGARIEFQNERIDYGEEIADIIIYSSQLKGIDTKDFCSSSFIDEVPVLAVLANFADGETVIRDVSELKFKESDRIESIIYNLKNIGINTKFDGNNLYINPKKQHDYNKITIKTFNDHRIAMSFLTIAAKFGKNLEIDETDSISVSFPEFPNFIRKLGINLN